MEINWLVSVWWRTLVVNGLYSRNFYSGQPISVQPFCFIPPEKRKRLLLGGGSGDYKMGILARNWLTIFPPMTYFYTPWKRQKKPLTCSQATEVGQRQEKSYYTYRYLLFMTFVFLRQTTGVQIKTSNECIAILFMNAWTEIDFFPSNYMQLIMPRWQRSKNCTISWMNKKIK